MKVDTDLPKDWKWVKLNDAGKVISGGTPSTTDPSYWSNEISWITPADLSGYPEKLISKGRKSISRKGLENSSAKLLPKGSVLFSSRAPIGYVAIASGELATNQGFKNIIPSKDVSSDFLYYYLKASKQLAEESASGTTFKEISGAKFGELPFPCPPLSEQQIIVSKIEELLSELDKGKQQLETAQQQLKIYRQAVLKWAFEGKLTNKEVKEGELPEGWKIQALKEITSILGDGLHGTPKYSESGGYYFINGNNLTDGKIEIKENTKRVTHEEYEKYKKPLNDKTILVSINGSLGYTAFYNNEKVVLGKSACYFNVLDNADKNYVRYLLTSNSFTSYAEKSATGSTIMNVGLKAMREFPVPMPPTIQEQNQIVQAIESRLTVCDKVEETITTSLQQAETLRQSILKKAFEGKLIS